MRKKIIAHRKANRISRKQRRKTINVEKDKEEVDKMEKEREKEKEERRIKKDNREKTRVKRLGPEKFLMPEIEVALSDEIPDSLRKFTPHTNLVSDQFSRLQRRGIIEPRSLKNYHRRYALKIKEKRLAKEFSERQAKKYASFDATPKGFTATKQ